MSKTTLLVGTLIYFSILSCSAPRGQGSEQRADEDDFVVIGYVPGFRGEIDETTIDATMLTHINYAFVNVRDSMAWLERIETDTVNLRKLNNLKKINPDLKILFSVGGWGCIGMIRPGCPICGMPGQDNLFLMTMRSQLNSNATM